MMPRVVRFSRPQVVVFLLPLTMALLVRQVAAQARPLAQVVMHSWTPSAPVTVGSTAVTGMSQLAVPLAYRFGGTRRVSVDVAGAAARTRVRVRRDATEETFSLDGLSDLRVLVTATAFDDRFAFLAGGTVPTGRTGLDLDQLQALAAVASPAVQAPMPSYGGGASGSAGMTTVVPLGRWDLSAGSSYEQRGQFQPFTAVEAGVPVSGTLAPGGVLTFTGRLDGRVGYTAVTLDGSVRQFLADSFAVSRGQVTAGTAYRLGPMSSVALQVRPATRSARDLVFALSAQQRAPYEVIGIGEIPRSDARLVAFLVSATLWRGGATHVAGGVEARDYSGIRSDSSLVTAAFRDVALSVSYARQTIRGEWSAGAAVGAGTLTPIASAATGARRVTVRAGWRPR